MDTTECLLPYHFLFYINKLMRNHKVQQLAMEKQNTTLLVSLIHCFFLTCYFVNSVAGVDTLLPNQKLSDGETIVSSGGSFELGFFSPGNSRFRYLGIRYSKRGNWTVVWLANRENPINGTSGVLKFDETGSSLVLYNQQDSRSIWSSNRTTQATGSVVAQLLDSGNLVVRNSDDQDAENYLWQCFDYPTHAFLPQMKIGLSKGLKLHLTSWKSKDDPSSGDYSLEVDESGLQLILREIKQHSLRARSGVWNGMGFNGLTYLKPNPIFTYRFVFTGQERYYTYKLIDRLVLTRLVVSNEGSVERYTWNDRANSWKLFLAVPVDNCDTYSKCGPYSSCDITNTPVCGCLKGFEPKNKEEWGREDWSSGCVRKTNLDCQHGDGFITFPNVKLPDMLNYSMDTTRTLEECRVKCQSECSCMAYASNNISGTGIGCFRWFGNLVDIKQFKEGAQDVYIRMAASETEESKKRKKLCIILIATLSSAGMALICVTILCLLSWNKRRGKPRPPGKLKEENAPKISLMNDEEEEDPDLPHFGLTTLAKATNNFSRENLLGKGGFGPVYKGIFDEQEVAVKRLSKESRQGLIEFKNEVKCIAKLQHRNLVRLVGYCVEKDEKMLIYEYMPNKSLDSYIFDQTDPNMTIGWTTRYDIIHGIVRGLLYLHQDSRLRIIHRDLKVSNILLDNDMNPKISDFGTARSFDGDETGAKTKRVVGTYGYMPPEYVFDGVFSIKSDVFSFGVLVLEIISGKRNRGFNHGDHQLNLLGHAWTLLKEGRYMELIDAYIMESCDMNEVLRSVHIGLLCVQHSPKDRPTMSTVALMLGGEERLPPPNEPGFFQERNLIDVETSSSKNESFSVNEISLTVFEPR